MKIMRWHCLLLLLIATPCISHSQNKPNARELFDKMMLHMSEVRTCSYVLNMEERVFGEIGKAQYLAKVNVNPLKIYTYSVFPNPGAEALYLENSNSGKVLVNPNRFPYINVNLSVNSMLLRKPHQYNILQMGFGYFHGIMKKNAIKYPIPSKS